MVIATFGSGYGSADVAELDEDETDFIKKYTRAAQVKLTKMTEHPHVFHFLTKVHLDESTVVPVDLQRRMEDAQHVGYAKLFNNIDTSLFRDDVSPEFVYKIIHWVMEGYQKQLIDSLKGKQIPSVDMDVYWDEFFELLAVLRRILYKQEGDGDGSRYDA